MNDTSLPIARRGSAALAGAWAFGALSYWAVNFAAILLASKLSAALAARSALVWVLPDALIAPLAYLQGSRMRWDRVPLPRLIVRVVLGGALFALLACAGFLAFLSADRRLATGTWALPPNPEMLAWKGLSAILVYATVFGIAAAIEQAGRAGRAESLRAEAQLEALRARLNPHFILNLLHTLMGLVAREPRAAEAALERLGGVLQYALRVQSQRLDEVRLNEEWEFVERYLALEALRLGERLEVRLEAEPATLEAIVPAFSLQPLVENAVRHAIAPRAARGRVEVSARRTPEGLVLAVEDDGFGSPAATGAGLGLRLIRERLQALYGDAARLETGRSPLGGFRAAVILPWEGGSARRRSDEREALA